ncbi:hypothetical protein Tco_1291350 [Tanacetum coccineum]
MHTQLTLQFGASDLDEDKGVKLIDPNTISVYGCSLMYLSASRPDIDTLRTIHMGLVNPKTPAFELKAFADADYAVCHYPGREKYSGSAQFLDIGLLADPMLKPSDALSTTRLWICVQQNSIGSVFLTVDAVSKGRPVADSIAGKIDMTKPFTRFKTIAVSFLDILWNAEERVVDTPGTANIRNLKLSIRGTSLSRAENQSKKVPFNESIYHRNDDSKISDARYAHILTHISEEIKKFTYKSSAQSLKIILGDISQMLNVWRLEEEPHPKLSRFQQIFSCETKDHVWQSQRKEDHKVIQKNVKLKQSPKIKIKSITSSSEDWVSRNQGVHD